MTIYVKETATNVALKRKYQTICLQVHKEEFKEACRYYNIMFGSAKTNYYKTTIESSHEKQLFELVDRIFHHNNTTPLPKHDSPQMRNQAFSEHGILELRSSSFAYSV